MEKQYPENWPRFFTATILNWKPLLPGDFYKDMVIDGFRYAIAKKRIILYAFVIMSKHIQLTGRLGEVRGLEFRRPGCITKL